MFINLSYKSFMFFNVRLMLQSKLKFFSLLSLFSLPDFFSLSRFLVSGAVCPLPPLATPFLVIDRQFYITSKHPSWFFLENSKDSSSIQMTNQNILQSWEPNRSSSIFAIWKSIFFNFTLDSIKNMLFSIGFNLILILCQV